MLWDLSAPASPLASLCFLPGIQRWLLQAGLAARLVQVPCVRPSELSLVLKRPSQALDHGDVPSNASGEGHGSLGTLFQD